MVLDESDMDTLMAWRRTCEPFALRVKLILRQLIHRIVAYYLPDPANFMDILRRHGAVIIEDAALAFFLRDPSVLSMELAICTMPHRLNDLRAELLRNYTMLSVEDDELLRQHRITDNALFWIGHRRYIRLRHMPLWHTYWPETTPLLSPIGRVAQSPHTALFNFVGADIFGCGYPELTLRRRAFMRAPWSALYAPERRGIFRLCAVARMTFSADSSQLFDDLAARVPVSAQGQLSCVRSHHVCDCEVRYFGDCASLVDFFDLDGSNALDLLHTRLEWGLDRNEGVVPGWRLWREREAQCEHFRPKDLPGRSGSWPLARRMLQLGSCRSPV